jgi:hypothetical protein
MLYARIISSSDPNTENANVTAEKSRDGAIIWCGVNHDYATECIRHTLEDDTSLHPDMPSPKTPLGPRGVQHRSVPDSDVDIGLRRTLTGSAS